MKRLLCLVLSFILLISCFPVAFAASGQDGNLRWTFDESSGRLTISGKSKMIDYAYPEKAAWYRYKDKITRVVLENGVLSVGSYAFDGYSKLTTLTLPESVTSIGTYAFHNCDALTSFRLPSSLSSIDSYAFYDCDGMTSLMLPAALSSWGRSVFCSCDSLATVMTESNARYIGPLAFYQCKNLKSVHLASTVTTIANDAFYNCSSLSRITLPEDLVSLGSGAFGACWALTDIRIPKNVQYIDLDAFRDCSALTAITVDEANPYFESHEGVLYTEDMTTLKVYPSSGPAKYTIPEGVKIIDTNALRDAQNPTELKFPSTLTQIKSRAFAGHKGLSRVSIDGAIELIAAEAFYDAKALSNVYIEGNFVVDNKAFYDCNKLGLVTLIGCKKVEYEAFYNCNNLLTPTFSEGITYIGARAFYNCSSLSSVLFPESLQYIGSMAFYGCNALKWVYILNPGCYFHNWESEETFGGPDGQKIRFHGEIFSSARAYAQKYGHYTTSHTLDDEGKCTCSGRTFTYDNGYWSYDAGSRVAYVYGYENVPAVSTGRFNEVANWYHYQYCISTLVLGNDTKVIGNSAFCDQTMLTSLNLVNVEQIGHNAFKGCTALERLYIPDTTTMIGNNAFADCTGMFSAVIRPNVTSIGYGAFSGCSMLTRIDVINTDCTIADAKNTLGDPSYTVIAGFAGSTAQAYANKYGYSFLLLENPCDYGVHSYYISGYVLSDCVNPGVEYHSCSCGASFEVEIPPLGHNVCSAVVEPTCTEGGYTEHYCTRCDYGYTTEETEPTGHTLEYIVIAPECEKDGYTDVSCLMCSYREFIDPTPATGHNYKPQIFPVTCTERGYTEYHCSGCSHTYIDDIIEPIGHNYSVNVYPATCIEGGYTEYYCKNCYERHTSDPTPPTEHAYRTEVIAPSCTTQGYTQYYCTYCSASYQDQLLDPVGHNYITTVYPTSCRFEGYTEYHCHGCGDHFEADFVPKAPHNFLNGRCAECNAPDPNHSAQPDTHISFNDVSNGSWFADSVNYAVSKKLMNGTGGGKFEPNTAMSRAMLVTVLWRYEGEPAKGSNQFTDVKNGQWYTKAVAWAASEGIVGGVGNNRFAPNGNITREQLATILFRYCASVGIDTSKRTALTAFPDSGKVSSYAKDAFSWAVAVGLVTGTKSGSKTYLDPQGNATRAQVATILMRFIETVAK